MVRKVDKFWFLMAVVVLVAIIAMGFEVWISVSKVWLRVLAMLTLFVIAFFVCGSLLFVGLLQSARTEEAVQHDLYDWQ